MRWWVILLIAVVGLIVGVLGSGYPALGTHPDAADRQRFETSPEYSKEKSLFHNRRENIMEALVKRFSKSDYFTFLMRDTHESTPQKPLPTMKPDMVKFMAPSEDIKAVWFGHSTLLVNIGGKIILIDPNFSLSASPYGFMVKRFQRPALELSELPPVDWIVISHDHYDHLDMKTVQFFKNMNTRFAVPLGVGSHLKGWGISAEKINELDWWQRIKDGDLELIATPAQHRSGRTMLSDQTLWASWTVNNGKLKFFYTGDGGYDTHFKEIGQKFGPFDVAFMENGQYNEKWHEVHLLPPEIIQAFTDVNAKRMFPVHWGMFDLSPHPWYEPIMKTTEASKEKGFKLISPELGEVVEINDSYVNKEWWKDFVK